jgi:hypothetical protein
MMGRSLDHGRESLFLADVFGKWVLGRKAKVWRKYLRAHLGGVVVLALCSVATAASSQALNSGGGAKFIKNSDKSTGFKKVINADPCHHFSPVGELKFCPEGTDWQLENNLSYGTPALYRLDDERKAAITVIQMTQGAAAKLDIDQIDELVERKTFEEGPRGRRELVSLISAKRTAKGLLHHMDAVIRENDGNQALLQVNVRVQEYGLALTETTVLMPTVPADFRLSEDQIAFDTAFRKSVKVAVKAQVKK